ncbi:Glutamate decarboxylase [Eumeta japonica]|uniref:Glutamate decarboxylase n=1 Tax=Eumeta variegata TaxID=151549 RepID=A0A4C2A696_EUMVA|nr:Glutamate decarboxylase [Eumeta japonica]
MSAEYLFMTDKQYDISYDTGDKVIQCGRHNDIFKLWLQWRSKGTEGFERQQDRLMELTEYQVKRIKEQSDRFHLILEPELSCSKEKLILHLRSVPLLRAYDAKGSLMVGYQPDDRRPNFFRSIISSAAAEADVDFMLDEIHRLGDDL